MPPKDRNERMQERLRGAGGSHASANFAFNFGAPLKPQRSSKRTPQPRLSAHPSSRKTPDTATRNLDRSGRRHRSASAILSSAARGKPSVTPSTKTQLAPQLMVTPTVSTGKRKRGQKAALSQSPQTDEQDELERIDEEHLSSAQRSTLPKPKATITASPVHDDAPDELEAADENHLFSSGNKTAREGSRQDEATPVPARANAVAVEKRRTPLAEIDTDKSTSSRKSVSAKSAVKVASKDVPPVTPATRPLKRTKKDKPVPPADQASKPSKRPRRPAEDDVEDELSPEKSGKKSFKVKKSKPAPVGRPRRRISESEEMEANEEDADELSPEAHKSMRKGPKSVAKKARPDQLSPELEESRPGRRATIDRDKSAEEEVELTDELDELSPDVSKTKPVTSRSKPEVAPSDEESDQYEESEVTEEAPDGRTERADLTQRAKSRQQGPQKTDKPHPPTKSTSLKPPKKRLRRTGPSYPIEVLRLKMAKDVEQPEWIRYVKGVNPAEVLNQFFKEMLDEQVGRIRAAVSEIQSPERRRHERGKVGITRLFQTTLGDLFLDLASASNNMAVLTRRIKNAKKDKILMRKEYMEVQNRQNELLLQMDELREDYQQNVRAREARSMLNESIFDIQAAIENGRERAKAEGREDDGPDVPLTMLMRNVAEDVGSENGGLLVGVQEFNTLLEHAAGILEGRA